LRLRAGEDQAPVIQEMHSSGALAFRPTKWGVWMVGTAAHPIGGDRLRLRVTVGSDCHTEIRSAAATLARRAAGQETSFSSMAQAIRVGSRASLKWCPEPGIAARGAHHQTETRVRLAPDSRLVWWDEVTLGRHGEAPGTWRSRMRITVDREPVLSSDLALGPDAAGWESRSVLAGAKAVSTVVVVDGTHPRLEAQPVLRLCVGTATAISLPLAPSGAQITAWGALLSDCRSAVDRLLESLPANQPEFCHCYGWRDRKTIET
jgi:urease accessory protein